METDLLMWPLHRTRKPGFRLRILRPLRREVLVGLRDLSSSAGISTGTRIAVVSLVHTEDSMQAILTGFIVLSLTAFTTFACTFRTDLLAGSPGRDSGAQMGGTGGQGGMGGSMFTGGTTMTGGTASTGESAPPTDDRACAGDDDCVQCIYATAPSNPDQCENALGCCGGPVMNKTVCATNQAAWQVNCSNRGYTVPSCPCTVCSGVIPPTCRNGECGLWNCP